jgi:DNA-binding transcriptional LysR family regulator
LLDAGFMYGDNESARILAIELQQLRLVVAGPMDWQNRLAAAKPEDLGQFPWIMTPGDCPFHAVASQLFKKHGIDPDQVALVDQESALKTMVNAGVGISLVLEQDVTGPGKCEFALWQEEDLFLTFSIACLNRRKEEPILQTLLSILTRIWEVTWL